MIAAYPFFQGPTLLTVIRVTLPPLCAISLSAGACGLQDEVQVTKLVPQVAIVQSGAVGIFKV